MIYKSIYPEPRNWYDHYLHLGRSLLELRVDVPGLPQFYQDKIVFDNKIYLPFPPGASLALIPFIIFFKNITQQQVSIILGSLEIVLIYFLLLRFTKDRIKALLLSVFFAFGTVFFWSSVVGTTWFFAHVVSILFLSISLLLHFSKKDFFSGLFLALSALTRLPLSLAGIFFTAQLFKNKKRLLLFALGCGIFLPIFFFYNWARFGDITKTGYEKVYQQYISSNYPYTIRQVTNPNNSYFGYMDIRNTPLHLYTLFAMPPRFSSESPFAKPSPYGMGIIFISPLLLLVFLPPFKKPLEKRLALGALAVSVPSMLHYMQGWVQFGYRFILDYVLFLMIILAIRFRITKFNMFLIIFSILVNIWGVAWAIKLGW